MRGPVSTLTAWMNGRSLLCYATERDGAATKAAARHISAVLPMQPITLYARGGCRNGCSAFRRLPLQSDRRPPPSDWFGGTDINTALDGPASEGLGLRQSHTVTAIRDGRTVETGRPGVRPLSHW